MKQKIMFDLDDTLIYCNKYFHYILDQFADEMTTWYTPAGISRASIMEKQTAIDIARIDIQGFKSEHFPQSFIDTYRYFHDLTGRATSPLEEEKLWKLGLSVYEQEVEPYPMMNETLDTLATRGHELHLYTGGDSFIQRKKIDHLNLGRYFQDRIYVRQHKNTEALEQILTDGRFDRENT